jgi:hypothetical protein
MGKVSNLVLFLLFATSAFAQSIVSIDKLEKTSLAQAKKEVGFSTTIEGSVDNPNLTVLVLVKDPKVGLWKPFPAAVYSENASGGKYRWSAICQFGERDSKGDQETYQVRAIAFDKSQMSQEPGSKLPASTTKTDIVTLKRTK